MLELDFGGPYPRFDVTTELEKELGREWKKEGQLLFPEFQESEKQVIDKLIERFIEPRCEQPSFIVNHPLVLSPLAKPHKSNTQLTERFELFINK